MTDAHSIKNSALWAAYGDALGFITELADSRMLKKRTNSLRVATLVAWTREVGGRFGTRVEMPSGCYSDDTQLRLATTRAIRGDGEFDVEAFAKVELPVWLSYSLGGGVGTKAAAAALTKDSANWFSNFSSRERYNYLASGGNGAAMRIQPHIWAASNRSEPKYFMCDVIRNAICTHGHPRGILGAVFHAITLAGALDRCEVGGPDTWREALEFFPAVADVIRGDPELGTFWLPVWEERSRIRIDTAFSQVKDELASDISQIQRYFDQPSEVGYAKLVAAIGGTTSSSRGSGTKTALIAAALTWMFRKEHPAKVLAIAANALGSDTDTIATMAGAIAGAVAKESPKSPILDRAYIETEAVRLYELSCGQATDSFAYPDLLRWCPPRRQLDAVGKVGNRVSLAGLALVKTTGKTYDGRSKDIVWQWAELDFGQTVLVKRRRQPTALLRCNYPMAGRQAKPKILSEAFQPLERKARQRELGLNPLDDKSMTTEAKTPVQKKTLHDLTSDAIKSGFDPGIIGRHILELAQREDGIEHALGYVSIIAKARIARSHQLGKTEKKRNKP